MCYFTMYLLKNFTVDFLLSQGTIVKLKDNCYKLYKFRTITNANTAHKTCFSTSFDIRFTLVSFMTFGICIYGTAV